jgi:hypothetical protein
MPDNPHGDRFGKRIDGTDEPKAKERRRDELHRHNITSRPGMHCTHGGDEPLGHEHPELGYGPSYLPLDDD